MRISKKQLKRIIKEALDVEDRESFDPRRSMPGVPWRRHTVWGDHPQRAFRGWAAKLRGDTIREFNIYVHPTESLMTRHGRPQLRGSISWSTPRQPVKSSYADVFADTLDELLDKLVDATVTKLLDPMRNVHAAMADIAAIEEALAP